MAITAKDRKQVKSINSRLDDFHTCSMMLCSSEKCMAMSSWIIQKCNFKQGFKNSEYGSIFIKCQKRQNNVLFMDKCT